MGADCPGSQSGGERTDQRLRFPRRRPQRGAGGRLGLGELVVPGPVRRPVGVRAAARRQCRALVDPARGRLHGSNAATSRTPWCCGPSSAPRRGRSRSPTRSPSSPAREVTTSACTRRRCWSVRWRGCPVRCRCGCSTVPRFEYGRTIAYLIEREDMLEAIAGAARLTLRGSVRLACRRRRGRRRRSPSAPATTHNFTLGYAPTYDAPLPEVPDADQTIADTVAGWRSWADAARLRGALPPSRCGAARLVVQGMTYRPSGAVVASVTTSLPEKLGGDRNYDYRYVWVRDFSLTLRALWRSACLDEVRAAVRLVGPGDGPGRRQAGAHHVRGAGGAGPHRAPPGPARRLPRQPAGGDRQRRVAAAAERHLRRGDGRRLVDARQAGADVDPEVQHLLRVLADQAARDWQLPDAGMWEERGAEHHHVSSKVQCWVALDRAVRFGDQLGEPQDAGALGGRPATRSARRCSSGAGATGSGRTPGVSSPTSWTRRCW